jgi:hypothetical protein
MVVARYLGEVAAPSRQEGIVPVRMQRFGRIAVDPETTVCPREILVGMPRVTDPAPCYLLFGVGMPAWQWSDPLPASPAVVTYLRGAPPPATVRDHEEPRQLIRLRYFLRHLEAADAIVAEDAYGEFANTDYKVIVKLRTEFPRELLAKWLIAPTTPASRRGLYGLLLGLCGDQDDARMMEQLILSQRGEEIRVGVDGIMGGYLLLTGEAGLAFLERTKIRPPDVPFTEAYAACQALRFAWQYAESSLPREAVRRTMRSALEREDMADLIIADLARWKDWELAPRLMRLYGSPGYDTTTMRRAIIRFLAVCAREPPTGDPATDAWILAAKRHLEELRRREPSMVKDALRFLVPLPPDKIR